MTSKGNTGNVFDPGEIPSLKKEKELLRRRNIHATSGSPP
jgi:hypothetical protein